MLVGAPAVGKSTVGQLLARLLDVEFIDVDALIEQRERRTIAEIFAADGEPGFRAIELDATAAALAAGGVVALGGGAVSNPAVRAALSGHRVVWLRASLQSAVRRVGDSTTRPLLTGDVAGQWSKLAAERAPWYAQVATAMVDTDRGDPAQIAHTVLTELNLSAAQ